MVCETCGYAAGEYCEECALPFCDECFPAHLEAEHGEVVP